MIDGTAFCYRAFHAIRGLSTADGRPTNAVYGFIRMLDSLREKERPDFLAVAFDVGKPTFRHQRFEAYKVQRKPMPDPLIAQLPLVKRLLEASRVPVFEREGYEAEDVLGTIARRIVGQGVEVFLVTGDKDALQLVNSHIKVYNPHREEAAVLDADAVQARYGVGPERLVDLMALMGDATDNIPSVPGIGEKTASGLLQRFGTLDALYEHLDELESPARRASLAASRDQVALSRELARIDTEVPLDVRLDDLRPREPDWPRLRALLRELEFKQLLQALDARAPAPAGPATAVRGLTTPQEVEACLQRLGAAPEAGVFCQPVPDGILLAMACEERAAWVTALDRETLTADTGRRLCDWLADPRAPKVAHDAKAIMRLLARFGIELDGITGDPMLAAYLLNPARTNQELSDLSAEWCDEPLGALPKRQEPSASLAPGLSAVPSTAQAGAAEPWAPVAQRACAIVRLHRRLLAKLRENGLEPLYADLELPLLHVLARMEAAGVAVDLRHLAGLSASMQAQMSQLTTEIYRLAGTEFNLNSPRQLAQVLFERLALPVVKRTKTGPSTDSDVLAKLAAQHPLPQQLIQYRELSKLVSTYVEALPKLVDPATGRLHTTFNQTATATGRLSSSDPNLQNIPVKTELGRSIRKAFIAGLPDGVLLAADYTQVELRILAHLSGDEQLVEAFRKGHDIHRVTASLIYGLPEEAIQPAQRNAMKAVNFGILYGMSARGLSQELGIPLEEAQAFIEAYFQRYPKVRAYLDSQIERARRDGFVQTLLGRRRYIPEVNSPDGMTRQFGERMAINAPIQGTAADLIKRAMVQLDERLARERMSSRMVLQVHDELVLETPRGELERLSRLVRDTMEGAIALDVPLTVTLKAGPNWLELSELPGA
ncbi:MAG: DNA polymerase I [Candidatus Omnitrophica bacterium]|nr:DNA polymerase I [Candidatus Omnitrophota bacterium]